MGFVPFWTVLFFLWLFLDWLKDFLEDFNFFFEGDTCFPLWAIGYLLAGAVAATSTGCFACFLGKAIAFDIMLVFVGKTAEQASTAATDFGWVEGEALFLCHLDGHWGEIP